MFGMLVNVHFHKQWFKIFVPTLRERKEIGTKHFNTYLLKCVWTNNETSR